MPSDVLEHFNGHTFNKDYITILITINLYLFATV